MDRDALVVVAIGRRREEHLRTWATHSPVVVRDDARGFLRWCNAVCPNDDERSIVSFSL